MECPFINRAINPNPQFNERVDYIAPDGSEHYVFYRHSDSFGKTYPVQFCQHIGRKRDVFQCLNENEWGACFTYQFRKDKSWQGAEPQKAKADSQSTANAELFGQLRDNGDSEADAARTVDAGRMSYAEWREHYKPE